MEGPLIYPSDDGLPAGSFVYPAISDPNWSEGFLNGSNPDISISPPTQTDFSREDSIRRDLIGNNQVSRARTRNISFADYQFTDQFGSVRTGTIEAFSGKQNVDDYALFVPLEDRVLKTFVVDEFNREVDTEAKILEQILSETTESDVGTIRLFTTRSVCDSCGQVIEEFVKKRPEIKIEVVEGN